LWIVPAFGISGGDTGLGGAFRGVGESGDIASARYDVNICADVSGDRDRNWLRSAGGHTYTLTASISSNALVIFPGYPSLLLLTPKLC
jgi:hypothetical protein